MERGKCLNSIESEILAEAKSILSMIKVIKENEEWWLTEKGKPYQENKKQIFDEKQYPQNEKSSSENNFEESNSGIGNFQFYSVGTAKNITEDIIDKKITQNLFYPEKAKRRGIEGEIKIKIEISKDGELISYQIISKKNNLILEEASIQTLQKIFPIEELKIKNAEENFSTIITLLYKLN
jgi:TonB family protein